MWVFPYLFCSWLSNLFSAIMTYRWHVVNITWLRGLGYNNSLITRCFHVKHIWDTQESVAAIMTCIVVLLDKASNTSLIQCRQLVKHVRQQGKCCGNHDIGTGVLVTCHSVRLSTTDWIRPRHLKEISSDAETHLQQGLSSVIALLQLSVVSLWKWPRHSMVMTPLWMMMMFIWHSVV